MKKWIEILLFTLLGIGWLLGGLYFYSWYAFNKKFVSSQDRYTERIAYINADISLLSEGF
jgi:hypothetical protein